MKYLISVAKILLVFISFSYGWSFAVLGDNRAYTSRYGKILTEIRDRTVNPEPKFSSAEFIVAAGDIDPVKGGYENAYLVVFPNSDTRPPYFPVVGNHEEDTDIDYIVENILPKNSKIITRDNDRVNYYVDWKNVRLIVVDQYSDTLYKGGGISFEGIAWIKSVIDSIGPEIEHVFISFHEPCYPVKKYVGSAFDMYPKERDAFWKMISSYGSLVKAVFTAHLHFYTRIEKNGIYEVGVGSAGEMYSDDPFKVDSCAFVRVEVNGKQIKFRTMFSCISEGLKDFNLVDSWQIDGDTTEPPPVMEPAFTSADSITLPANTSKGYRVEYNDASCNVVTLKKPSWTLIKNDSVAIYAPKSSCVDSMVFQLKNSSGTPVDTLVLKITVTGGVGIVSNDSKTNVLGISPQISSKKSGFDITLPIAGKYSVCVYDISGKEVWKYQSTSFRAGSQYVSWGNIATNRKISKNGIYFAVLRQGNKKVSVKLNFVL